ncbi:MAG TPA: hypothetical protein VN611_06440 [Patescibacteria group bacterium]|nr:hypothetical protein [Patescibacteria group bacterium]
MTTFDQETLAAGELRERGSQQWQSYTMRLLNKTDLPEMLALYDAVVAAMEDPNMLWRYDDAVVEKFLGEDGMVIGVFCAQRLIGFRVLYIHHPGDPDNPLSCIGQSREETAHLALCVILPKFRGSSLQKKMGVPLLRAAMAEKPFTRLCSIVSPHNYPSISDKIFQGMVVVKLMPKFKGIWRYIFYRDMTVPVGVRTAEPVFALSADYPRQIELLEQGYQGVQLERRDSGDGMVFRR